MLLNFTRFFPNTKSTEADDSEKRLIWIRLSFKPFHWVVFVAVIDIDIIKSAGNFFC